MNAITLPKDLEDWALAEVAAGRAESVDALVAEAMVLHREELAYVQCKIAEAYESIAREGTIDGDVVRGEIDRWIADLEAEAALERTVRARAVAETKE